MKLLIVTQNFYPENFKSNDIAFEMQKRGHQVDVLTGIPNYPEGVYFNNYGVFKRRKEVIDGVKIYRVFQTPRGRKPSALRMALNYLTFAFFSCFWVLFFLFKKYDSIIVHQTSPFTQALPAYLISRIKKIPLYIWILDLWPEVLIYGVGIKNRLIIKAMTNFIRNVYKHSKKILYSSKGFAPLIKKQCDDLDKIVYFPNWAEDVLDLPIKDIPELPQGFRIMMAGNLGIAQNLKNVMSAAYMAKDIKEVKWIFIGDGSRRRYIEEFRDENHLEDTVFVLGRYPFEYIPAFYRQADAMLLSLKADSPQLKAVVPARLQSYMAAGKMVLAMIDGGSAELIQEANCGYSVLPDDYVTLVSLLKDEILNNRENVKKLGINGRKYYEEYFTKHTCLNNLERLLSDN